MKKFVAIVLGMAIAISCIGMFGCSEKEPENNMSVEVVNDAGYEWACDYVSKYMSVDDSFELEPCEFNDRGVATSYWLIVDDSIHSYIGLPISYK